jgi:HK97 family phage major capsid protein
MEQNRFFKLYRNSKKNSLYGFKAKRTIRIMFMAAMLFISIGAFAYTTDTMSGKVTAVTMATIPLAAFAVPKELGLKEQETKGLEALAEHFRKELEKYEDGAITEKEFGEKMTTELKKFAEEYGLDKEKFKKLEDSIKEQGIAIKAIQENGTKSDRKTFDKKLKDLLSSDDFKTSMKAGRVQAIETKAATVITTTNAANAPHALSYEVVSGIQESPQEENVIFPTLLKGSTSSRTIIWVNRVDGDGGAAFIAEGILKPLKDWSFKEESSTAKKIAVSTKVSMEMLNDFEYMRSEIGILLRRDLFKVLDEKLLGGAGGNEPTGITTVSGGYVGTTLDGTIIIPNNADAIRASMLQMRLLNYKPNVVFMNPSDTAALDLVKTSDGHYIKVETNAIMQRIRVIETTEVAADHFLLMDTAKWIVRVLEDLRLEFGWENDDFRKNLVTIIAEMRLHSYQNSIDAGAEIYEQFSVVKTALAA